MAADARPFAEGAARVWTIPPGTDFLGSLAAVLRDTFDLRRQPAALADSIIYVPNRRSARALALALFDSLGGTGTLLPPDIRTLGDLESDDAPPVAETALAALPPVLAPATYQGVLAQLASAFYRRAYSRELPPASALATARELARLLEHAAMGEPPADWSTLEQLVEQSDLAVHWKTSTDFLSIITDLWPQWLKESGAADPFKRRQMAADALVGAWSLAPPDAPVIVAGSTGATPSGRTLMRAALRLPKGLVVLPGLDTALTAQSQLSIAAAPSHPQFTLVRTLTALNVPLGDVATWPAAESAAGSGSRRRLIYEALAPADETADWRETLKGLSASEGTTPDRFVRGALEGLSVIELPDEAAEAQAAALLLRGVLETTGATGALVTPDAGLARRTGALLERWGIQVPPSAGQPLGRTGAGSLISLCARWASDPADPVALSAVLKHPFVQYRSIGNLLDLHFLRGPRRWETLADLADWIEVRHIGERMPAFSPEDQSRSAAFVRQMADALRRAKADLSAVDRVGVADGVRRIAALAEAVSETPLPWAGEDGAGASRLLQRIDELGRHLDDVAPGDLAELIETECAALTVSLGEAEHPRLSIWGPLEARLQTASLIVLAGLNEDVWPEKTSPDVFLPRRFRAGLGLPDPDERLGLSAHDFAQLACAPNVVMLHSARREDAPAVASRWVWRLRTLVQGALRGASPAALAGENADLPDWAHAIQAEGIDSRKADPRVAPRPKRRPKDWPRRLSVTRIDRLQRDPYAIWAEDVLGLSVLDPMNGPVQPNLRGTATHKAIERFELDGGTGGAAGLTALLREEMARAGDTSADWLSKAVIWQDVANWFVDWRQRREASGGLALETSGELQFQIAGAAFTLRAQADRIETNAAGEITIIDFKTGAAPTDKMIKVGFDQQMPLQALIASKGGFAKVPAGRIAGLDYVEFKGKPGSRTIGASSKGELTPDTMVQRAEAGLQTLIAAYRDPDAYFASAPRTQYVKYDYGYNLLARRAEWTSDTEDGADD